MNEITQQTLSEFLDKLASRDATPGGGSAAAIMGAQSAALTSMVCNLTIGKPQYAEVEADMQALLQKSERLRQQLTDMIQADVDVFNELMACYRLPKNTEAEKNERSQKIQAILKQATQVPLDCAKACAEAIEISQIAAEKGSLGVISDAGVAVMAAYAGLKSAALNVYINIGSLKDQDFAQQKKSEMEAILDSASIKSEEIYQLVKNKL
ncbi:methenyltetrahydrofolate cyclohydrolase [methane-oxidizing endosymbiont of Gigantopelta aegis]|uniref:methenyltetrahydrofolate cyclohydrolase n=1 Tax=methane-oxidizing endosymbiont of Gigantopelta aegis TaxID=2794938 RepID=UPI0018DB427F|nr:methenyltetrahydrofolate cyclohydrolase [methane-oxidizing endosymbiont of Gigantopelta aegis]